MLRPRRSRRERSARSNATPNRRGSDQRQQQSEPLRERAARYDGTEEFMKGGSAMNLVPWRSKRRDDGSRALSTRTPFTALRSEVDRVIDRFMREPLFGGGDEPFSQLGAWAPEL